MEKGGGITLISLFYCMFTEYQIILFLRSFLIYSLVFQKFPNDLYHDICFVPKRAKNRYHTIKMYPFPENDEKNISQDKFNCKQKYLCAEMPEGWEIYTPSFLRIKKDDKYSFSTIKKKQEDENGRTIQKKWDCFYDILLQHSSPTCHKRLACVVRRFLKKQKKENKNILETKHIETIQTLSILSDKYETKLSGVWEQCREKKGWILEIFFQEMEKEKEELGRCLLQNKEAEYENRIKAVVKKICCQWYQTIPYLDTSSIFWEPVVRIFLQLRIIMTEYEEKIEKKKQETEMCCYQFLEILFFCFEEERVIVVEGITRDDDDDDDLQIVWISPDEEMQCERAITKTEYYSIHPYWRGIFLL